MHINFARIPFEPKKSARILPASGTNKRKKKSYINKMTGSLAFGSMVCEWKSEPSESPQPAVKLLRVFTQVTGYVLFPVDVF